MPLLKVFRSMAFLPVMAVGSVSTAPGWNNVSDEKFRQFSGMFWISFVESELPKVASVVSRMGWKSSWTTTWVVAPIFILVSIFWVWSISRVKGAIFAGLNPAASTVTV